MATRRIASEGRRPGERLALRFGEINHDALVSFFDGHTQTPALFCANSSTGWRYRAGRQCGEFTLSIYHIFLLATSLHE